MLDKPKKKIKKFTMILEEIEDLKAMIMNLEMTIQSLKTNRPKKKKQTWYYAVARGKVTGIYKSWRGANGAEKQIKGYSNALHRKFRSLEEANRFMDKHCEY
ncbi:hypothetical protein MTBBW1_2740006 [Desulfamplus magnetovallimortis]|uniref:ribonuclease H n=1 Tax=Desulfamplus magnetovallimortis TaxID=1246637 RepID=A0A1W1HFJ0_9BACT|nr:RNase H1/viroplasmin domain-containing protein [Desulfamplus magnetovallimortis]SLM31145.1 hypothetical protein MTBBW1_2740006 [Desulfamplus magnetovallimortis]